MNQEQIKKICVAGLFAAIIALVTFVIRIPIPGTSGYLNFGDSVIFLFAFLLANPYVALAAGLGSALTDLLAGAAIYIIPTFLIKGLMGLTVSSMAYQQKNLKKILAALLLGGAMMVLGYFCFEWIFYGLAAASLSLVYNLLQYAVNVIAGMLLIQAASRLGIQV